MNSLLVNDEETNGSGGEMEEAVEEEIEVFVLEYNNICICNEQYQHMNESDGTRYYWLDE